MSGGPDLIETKRRKATTTSEESKRSFERTLAALPRETLHQISQEGRRDTGRTHHGC